MGNIRVYGTRRRYRSVFRVSAAMKAVTPSCTCSGRPYAYLRCVRIRRHYPDPQIIYVVSLADG